MERAIKIAPACAHRIFPFIGGSEINDHPEHKHHRFIIDFGTLSEDEARAGWPVLMNMLEEKVYPLRQKENRKAYRQHWWRHGERRVALYRKLELLEEVIAFSQTSKYRLLAILPAKTVFSTKAVVVTDSSEHMFCVLQSRVHETWSTFFGSSLEDRPVYTPSDCFETFPFPQKLHSHPDLEEAGMTYYAHRAQLMVTNGQGLTKTYNRFHNPEERDAEILKLRELHAAMDRAVLDAYGWTDIPTDCEFLLDYEIDEEEWGTKKKPYRYRWPQEVHDEVLARLLDLNQKRAEEERLAGLTAEPKPKKKGRRKKSKSLGLFDDE